MKQSPTMGAIRIMNKRWRQQEKTPAPRVIDQRVTPAPPKGSTSHQGDKSPNFKATVKAVGRDRETAIRQAAGAGSKAIAAQSDVSLPAFRLLQAQLAGMTGLLRTMNGDTQELKRLNAKILQEAQTSLGVMVELEIEQSVGELIQCLREDALPNFRLVTLLPEFQDGMRLPSARTETDVIAALLRKNFTVYDSAFLTRNGLQRLIDAALSERPDAALTLGDSFLANVIVTGRAEATFSQENSGILSYRAAASVRAVQVSTGQILTATNWEEKGFGRDRTQATRNALTALTEKISKQLPAALEGKLDANKISIEVTSEQQNDIREAETFLRSLRAIVSVQRKLSGSGRVTLEALSKEPAAALGVAIEESGDYRVV